MLLALPAISTFAFLGSRDVCCWREKCVGRFQSRDPSVMSCALPVRCWYEKKQIAKSCVRDSRPRVRLSSGARSGLRCDSDCANASICLSVSCCARYWTRFAISKSPAYGDQCHDAQFVPAWLSGGLRAY